MRPIAFSQAGGLSRYGGRTDTQLKPISDFNRTRSRPGMVETNSRDTIPSCKGWASSANLGQLRDLYFGMRCNVNADRIGVRCCGFFRAGNIGSPSSQHNPSRLEQQDRRHGGKCLPRLAAGSLRCKSPVGLVLVDSPLLAPAAFVSLKLRTRASATENGRERGR